MSVADELTKLETLHVNGALSDSEYAKAKELVLSGMPCGAAARNVDRGNSTSDANFLREFRRSSQDRILGGICGALGARTPVPSWTWRVGFCLMCVAYGFGLLAYVLLWIFVPSDANVSEQS